MESYILAKSGSVLPKLEGDSKCLQSHNSVPSGRISNRVPFLGPLRNIFCFICTRAVAILRKNKRMKKRERKQSLFVTKLTKAALRAPCQLVENPFKGQLPQQITVPDVKVVPLGRDSRTP